MKVALLNVRFSPNLGDGLLSQCLERELRAIHPLIEIVPCDLAGRTRFAPGTARRALLLKALEALPASVRRIATGTMLAAIARVRLAAHFRVVLRRCDVAILGGGNLFADVDLNFPTKIHCALSEAARANVPVAVYAVGVSGDWSRRGAALFRRALGGVTLLDASVRDDRSRDGWVHWLGALAIGDPRIVLDPGLLASRHFPATPRAEGARRVGLCITDPVALRYHGGSDHVPSDLAAWYAGVVAALAGRGYAVVLFTNGSAEDRAFLTANTAQLTDAGTAVTVAPAADDPAGLVGLISGFDLVVAHRMHACIAAHSYGIPAIGLLWDKKLDSFFKLAGRARWLADAAVIEPLALAALADQALADPPDTTETTALLDRASADVARLADILTAGVAQRVGQRPDVK